MPIGIRNAPHYLIEGGFRGWHIPETCTQEMEWLSLMCTYYCDGPYRALMNHYKIRFCLLSNDKRQVYVIIAGYGLCHVLRSPQRINIFQSNKRGFAWTGHRILCWFCPWCWTRGQNLLAQNSDHRGLHCYYYNRFYSKLTVPLFWQLPRWFMGIEMRQDMWANRESWHTCLLRLDQRMTALNVRGIRNSFLYNEWPTKL